MPLHDFLRVFRSNTQQTKKFKAPRKTQTALRYQELEKREVLNATFTFDAVSSLLTIDGFDDAGSDLSIDQNLESINDGAPEDAYVFTLGSGTFIDGGGVPADNFEVEGNTLTIGTDFFGGNGALDANVLIDGAVGADFVGLTQADPTDDIQFNSLQVANFQNIGGSLSLNVTGDVTLDNLSVVDNDFGTMPEADLSITTTGSIEVDGALSNSIENIDSGISLNASGGNSDVILNAAVTTVEGSIAVVAGDEVNFASTGSLTSADAGNLSVTANADTAVDGDNSDGIVMADGSFLDAGSGVIALFSEGDDGGDIVISSITTSNSTSDAVSINSGLGVSDGGDANSDIVADAAGAIVNINATAGVGSGDALEIQTDSIDVENTTLGNIELIEGAAGLDINILNLNNGASTGNISVQTVNGSLSLAAGAGGINTVIGTAALDANGLGNNVFVNNAIITTAGPVRIEADGVVVINASISTGGGDVNISSEDDVDFNPSGEITTFGGAVTVSAGFNVFNNVISMFDGALVDAGSGTITFRADENITLGGLRTSGDVNLVSNSGAVIDGGDTDTDIVAASVIIDATEGVGSTNALEIQVGNIDVDNTISGNISLVEEAAGGDITVLHLDNAVAAGDITVQTADGTISVGAAGTGIVANSGTVALTAVGLGNSVFLNNGISSSAGAVIIEAVGDVVINAPIQTSGGIVDISSGGFDFGVSGDITFGANGDITTADGAVSLFADFDRNRDGEIDMADGALIDAGAGTITLEADQDIKLGGLKTTGSVIVTTTFEQIIDGGDADADIVARSANLTAVSGLGHDNAIELQVDSINAVNSRTQDLNLIQQSAGGDIEVLNLVNFAALNNLTLTAESGSISVNAVDFGVQGLGDVALIADGADSSVFLNGAVFGNATVRIEANANLVINEPISANAVVFNSGDDIDFGRDGDITSRSGPVAVSADVDGDGSGEITMADGSLVDAGEGAITFSAGGDITLGGLRTNNSTANAVLVTTTGSVLDGGISDLEISAPNGTATINAGVEINGTDTFTNALNATSCSVVDIDEQNPASVIRIAVKALLGDSNLDGAVNFLDISTFVNFLSQNRYLAEADVNQDGRVTFLDISPFIILLASSSSAQSQVSFATETDVHAVELADDNDIVIAAPDAAVIVVPQTDDSTSPATSLIGETTAESINVDAAVDPVEIFPAIQDLVASSKIADFGASTEAFISVGQLSSADSKIEVADLSLLVDGGLAVPVASGATSDVRIKVAVGDILDSSLDDVFTDVDFLSDLKVNSF